MPSARDDQKFRDEIGSQLPSDLLDTALSWISSNLSPNDVFSDKEIFEAAADLGEPDSVFSERRLIEWAEQNGYTKE